eukprot:120333_1
MSLSRGFFAVYLFSLILSRCELSEFRLPTTIKPISYELVLHPDIPNDLITGTVHIALNVTNSYFDDNEGDLEVSFNYYPGMVISTTTLTVTDPNQTQVIQLTTDLELDETTQIAKATFDIDENDLKELLQTYPTATVTMNAEYTSLIRGGADLAGLYKSKYEYGNITVINLVTQFQATDARSVFPCFDEPAFKATFQITVCAPSNAIALSNMPIATRKPNEGVTAECIWTSPEDGTESTLCDDVTFQTTPVMSSYLVALAIGGFRRVNTSIDAVQTVYYPYGFDTKMAEFALTQSERVLSEFNGADGFDIVYTSSGFPKLDSVGVTDFAAGAMENWGLILYRTTRLLVDPELSTQNAKTNQLVTIAHELAHQWFGNLVSPHWWDDLWLSEGFATYMSYYGANLVEPEYNLKINKSFKKSLRCCSMMHLCLPRLSSKRLKVIPHKFALHLVRLRMKKAWVCSIHANVVGNDSFLEGITAYLKQYEFKTATSAQLAECWTGVCLS